MYTCSNCCWYKYLNVGKKLRNSTTLSAHGDKTDVLLSLLLAAPTASLTESIAANGRQQCFLGKLNARDPCLVPGDYPSWRHLLLLRKLLYEPQKHWAIVGRIYNMYNAKLATCQLSWGHCLYALRNLTSATDDQESMRLISHKSMSQFRIPDSQ